MGAFAKNILSVLNSFEFWDVIDILAVAVIIYYVIGLVRETRAMQLVKSIGVVFVVYFISHFVGLTTLRYLLQKVLDVGLIVVVVLFQPELRRALERLGRSRLTGIGKLGFSEMGQEAMEKYINTIVEGCKLVINQKAGALIVIEGETRLGEILATGVLIDADPSPELIGNIFFNNSPLHDGAVIMRDGKIAAAACYLPMSENTQLDKELGTRHRSALGISEISDAVTIVVSEERGTISVTQNSAIISGLTPRELKYKLSEMLILNIEEKKLSFKKLRARFFGPKKEEKDNGKK